ncbi:MAG TPA: hypothetical protein VHD87_15035 [Acidimicrobiales bacterium]|nr:hypothetical protein [Acidimicrobiales bacterium]
MTAIAPLPRETRATNRGLLDLARQAGCTISAQVGDFVNVRLPDGQTLLVRGPHSRLRNADDVVAKIMAVAAPEPATTLDLRVVDADADAAPPAAAAERAIKRRPNTGAANLVLEVLLTHGVSTTRQIAERTGLPRQVAGQAAAYLVQTGAAVRVKHAVYRAADAAVAPDHRVAIDIDVNRTAAPAPTTAGGVAHSTVADQPATSEVEETIQVLVDILFPGGMHLSGANLAALDQWRAATRRLLSEITAR